MSSILEPGTIHVGTAYGRPAPRHLDQLARVGPGTPMGELMRRYWHPIGLTGDATTTPRKVRALGEDLILFRDGKGRPGLVTPHCAHRGSSLYYGRVEEEGIRCCYHGWMFDVQGRCIDRPCEPPSGRTSDRFRQPWYPLEERYGLIWAYMGPPERQPLLPRYDAFEVLDEGEQLEADDSSIGGGGPRIIPCNWLSHYENLMDPFHVVVLHSNFSGTQFVKDMGVMPEVSFELSDIGVRAIAVRQLPDGKTLRRVSEAVVPTLRVVPNPKLQQWGRLESLGFVLPIDDESFRIYTVGRVKNSGDLVRMRSRLNGKLWEELTEEEHQRFPGDYEAQVSQGVIPNHSEEHLATTDKGIVMLRRFFQRQIEAVERGEDPVGLVRDPAALPMEFVAGNYLS